MSSDRWIIQSHRGAGFLGPENTLESFELGWKLGTVPEADVRQTKDGVIVAFHDSNLERLVKDAPEGSKQIRVGDMTWDEVSRMDVGAYMGEEFRGQRVPEMSKVFEAMRGNKDRWLYLDYKDVPLERLAALAREYGVIEQVILATTNYDLVREWKQIAPESMTLLWMGGSEERLRERMEELKAADFQGITQLQIHVHVGDLAAEDPFQPSSEFLKSVGEEIKPRGILFQTLPMGNDRVEAYKKLMALGVESFATDNPKVTLEAIGS